MTIPVTRQLIAEIRALLRKREPPSYPDVLKWDRNQPRGPKGSPTGGQWVAGVSAGEGTASSTFKPPEYGFGSSEDRRMAGANQASYAAIMNAPTGEGFGNTPRAVNFEPPQPEAPKTVASVLKEGHVESTEPLGGGANASYIVEFDDGTKAVYKPEVGERWGGGFANNDITDYVTNKQFSLAERETFAHEAGNELFGGVANNPVPETVLRESLREVDVDVSGGDDDEVMWDSSELREMYDEYKQKRFEGSAMYEVSDEMNRLFDEAGNEHVEQIEKRAEEMADIWNEVIEEFPDEEPYGTPEGLKEHPVLPLGSNEPFERKALLGALDPLEVLKEADVDVTATMNNEEKGRVEAILRTRLKEGYQELGDVDPDAAREHLDRDQWFEEHADTENRLMESKIQDFDDWVASNGYNQGGGGGGGGRGNSQAPHPNGGSLQKYVEADGWGSLTAEQGVKMAVLDYVIGTMDRHGSNLLWHKTVGGLSEPVAIDNGYSMPGGMDDDDDFRFRSVAVAEWMRRSDSEAVPETIRSPLLARLQKTDWQALVDRHPNMSREEREAFLGRVENMKKALSTEQGLSRLWRSMNLMTG